MIIESATVSNVSIVLLTHNGEKYLPQVLEMIRSQKHQPFEVLAIDSQSSDSTLEVLRKFEIPTRTILESKFSHPATRNMAARICSGRYIVFLTQDAVPADSCWLECLLRPFDDYANVAGTFSRQIPRPGASLLEANDLRQDFPCERTIKKMPSRASFNLKEVWKLIKFSNSSSGYDRNLLLQNPFDEKLEMGEDQEWAKRMLEQNFIIVYEPSSVVLHSHEHDLKQNYLRSLSMGKSFSVFLKPMLGNRSLISTFGAFLAHMLLDVQFILSAHAGIKAKCKWILLSPLHRAVRHYAYRKGWNSTVKVQGFSKKQERAIVGSDDDALSQNIFR
jgi:glycosyltransferase involved in cell wall biosynthesis